jgi:hypothetical protein
MLKSIHFQTEAELLTWVNENNVRVGDIISIQYAPEWQGGIRDDSEPEDDPNNWILFYCD